MRYSKDYFDLQLKFAHKVAQLTDKELSEVLLTYTSFYKLFGIPGWTFDVNNPTWQNYLKKLNRNPVETSYQFYLTHADTPADTHPQFGCFSYGVESDEGGDYIEIHFRNADSSKAGPLSKERMPARIQELKKMFTDIKQKHSNVLAVFAFSWLMNVDACMRLFPPSFQKNSRQINDWFRSAALWGQFLDSSGNVKGHLSNQFLSCCKTKNTLADLTACFPYPVRENEGKTADFYRFYGIN